MNILELRDLNVHFNSHAGKVHAVEGVNLTLEKGKILGIAGESGCGKSTIALSIPGLLPDNGEIDVGEIVFNGENLITKTEKEMEKIRWKKISVIFQGAMNAFNPLKTIGKQIVEPMQLHDQDITKKQAEDRTKELLEKVGIAGNRFHSYPHEFSGGMRQRAMIAMSLVCRPELVIADEPVTALDVMIQAQIMELIRDLCKEYSLSMIIISHDLSVLAELCDRISIMYGGKILEEGESGKVFKNPRHPYTEKLLHSYPDIHGDRAVVHGIPGYPPSLIKPPEGCPFYERCTKRTDLCKNHDMKLTETEPDHFSACIFL